MDKSQMMRLRTTLYDGIIGLLDHSNYCEQFGFEPYADNLESLLESIMYNSGHYTPEDFEPELRELFHSVDLSEELEREGLNSPLQKAVFG